MILTPESKPSLLMKTLLAVTVLSLCSSWAFAAAVVGTTTGGGAASNQLTLAHTVAAANDRILVVGVGWETDAPGGVANTLDVNSVTFGGTPLIRLAASAAEPVSSAGSNGSELWYLLNPNTGAGNVVITLSGTPPSSRFLFGAALNLSNVAQRAPEAVTSAQSLDSRTVSAALPVSSGSAMVSFTNSSSTNFNVTSGTPGVTRNYSSVGAPSTAGSTSVMGYDVISTAGSRQHIWNSPDADIVQARWAMSAASFAAVPEPSSALLAMMAGSGLFALRSRRS